MDRPTRMPGIDNFFVRYSLAVMATGIALALTLWLAPVVKPAVFLFFFAAVVLVAAIGGMGPAVLTAVLGFLTGEHFVVLPIYGFQFGVGIAARAIGFTVIAAFAGWMSDRQRKANASLREAHERLQAQAEQLKEQSRKLEVAYQDLNTRADELARTKSKFGSGPSGGRAQSRRSRRALADTEGTDGLHTRGDRRRRGAGCEDPHDQPLWPGSRG